MQLPKHKGQGPRVGEVSHRSPVNREIRDVETVIVYARAEEDEMHLHLRAVLEDTEERDALPLSASVAKARNKKAKSHRTSIRRLDACQPNWMLGHGG